MAGRLCTFHLKGLSNEMKNLNILTKMDASRSKKEPLLILELLNLLSCPYCNFPRGGVRNNSYRCL
jgi:hypothetical protein